MNTMRHEGFGTGSEGEHSAQAGAPKRAMSSLIRLVFLWASLACLGAWSGNAAAAVTWQAAGTAVNGTTAGGIGANPAWPAHQANDIALLFVESTGGEPVTLSIPNGFALVPNSPQATGAGTAGTQLTVFWARATSSAMAAPRIASPSDHFYARIITFRGVINAGNPWDVTGGGVKAVASTSVTVTGVTTTVANTLVVQAVARDNDNAAAAFSAQANVNLAGITERLDAGTANGNGGGLGVWAGVKAAAGATGNTTANVTSSINAFLTIALKPQQGPRFQAAGAGVGGIAAVSPVWPAHAVGDIALLFVESAGGQPAALSVPAGFAAVLNSPRATGAGTAGTRITVFWARATSAAMAAPTVADPGDHVYAQIITYRGVANAGNPWDVTGGGVKAAASTSVTVTGVTTTVANTLVVQAVARGNDSAAAAFSAQANVNLTGIAEWSDAGTNQGNGGGFAVWDGAKATAGATGNTTATVTSSINAFLTIALAPSAAPVPAPVYQALGGAVTTGLNWPTHAIDDIALLFIETTGGQIPTLADAAGFVEVLNSPQSTGAGTAGTRTTVFWARATSAAMVGPTITGPADHAYAQIITYRGAINTGNPWDVTGGGVKAGASTSVTVTGVTTTVANTLIVQAVARDNDNAAAAFSAQTNANLTGIAERSDAGTITGNGGGFAVWDGAKATAGATGDTTATVTSSRNAFLTIALKPSVVGPDHYELSLPAASVACLASAATVTACADSVSPCINKYTAASGTTATLATTAGALGLTTVTFDATGVATTTLSYPAAVDGATATVTLSAEQTAATNPRKCCQGGVCAVADSCATIFNTAGFIFSSSAGGAVATIPAQTAGTTSSSYYLRAVKTSITTQACEAALTAPSSVKFGYTCNNPNTCNASNLLDITPYNGAVPQATQTVAPGSTAVNLYFDANGNAPFTFNYRDAGQITINASKAAGVPVTLLTALAGSSNAFVTKPGGFVLSGIQQTAAPNLANPAAADAAGAKFVKAGEAFTVTVTATTIDGVTATPNYGQETAPESVKLTPALVAALGLTNNPAIRNIRKGSITAGGTALTVVDSADFGVGNRILVAGAGVAGTILVTTVAAIPNATTITLASAASTTIAGTSVQHGFSGGALTESDFAWDEVGIIMLTPSVGDTDYLGVGDVTGTAIDNVGRFYAASFTLTNGVIGNRADLGVTGSITAGTGALTLASAAGVRVGDAISIAGADVAGATFSTTAAAVSADGLTVTLAANAATTVVNSPVYVGTFTYMGELMNALFTLTAKAEDGTTTLQNYSWSAIPANQFAKLDPTAAANPLGLGAVDTVAPTYLTARLDTSLPASGSFLAGSVAVVAPLAITRGATADGPYAALNIGIAPADSDGVAMGVFDLDTDATAGNDHALIGTTEVRYGRLKLSNAHGSELLQLPINVIAQYWNGITYVTNTLDNNSTFAAVIFSNYQKYLAVGETVVVTPPASVVFTGGVAGYRLTAPGASNNGSVDMTVNALSTYLPSNTARATFGVYKGANEFIYLRENY